MNLKSYAKVNFILKVFPLKNRMHPVLSLMAKIDLYDNIKISLNNSGITTTTFNIKGISKKNNTVYKVIELLRAKTKFTQGVDVYINKRIPVKAGLGGGSSNAAVVLKYLNQKLKLKLGFDQLCEIAFIIGSDVASFLIDQPVIISEFGNKVNKTDFIFNDYILTIKPKKGISAKEAYQYFDKSKIKRKPITLNRFKRSIVRKDIYELMVNDLEFAVLNNKPWIKKVYQDLANYKLRKVMLSGSGSSVLAFSSNKKLLLDIKSKLRKKYDFISINKTIKTR